MRRRKSIADVPFTGVEQISDQSITEYSTKAMTRYATAVNLDRAIPELFDGLKPVARRVAWAATAFKGGPVKSARITGHTMGSFHPHGCLAADTMFYCTDGKFRSIKELYDNNVPRGVLAYDEEHNTLVPAIGYHWRIGSVTKTTYEITLSNNQKIVATPNHKFLTTLGWLRADELAVGNMLYSGNIYNIGSSLYRAVFSSTKLKDSEGDSIRDTLINDDDSQYVLQEAELMVSVSTIVKVDHEEDQVLYDFTVDKYHNALIGFPAAVKDNKVPFCITHNSSYGTIVGMVHDNVPLFTGIGNWGGLLDGAAAERYTNCCLSDVGWSCFDPNYIAVTDMVPNYDGKDKEPVIIPVQLPFVLLNGSDGIGVGVTCKLPSFTLESVKNVLVKLFGGEKLNHQLIAKILKPQLKYGGHFVNDKENQEQWLELIKTGRASIKYQSDLVVDEKKKEIEISEWPGSLNPEKFIAKVKLLPQVQRAYNSRGALTFKIEAKRTLTTDQFTELVKKVQKLASCSVSYRVNVTHREVSINDGIVNYNTQFLSLGISELILRWSKLRIELEEKSLKYRIEKQEKIIAYSKLLIFACSKLNIIFQALKQPNSEEYLVEHLKITKEEAKSILDLRVRQLSKLDQDDLKVTLKAQQTELAQLKTWLKNPKPKIKDDIIKAVALANADAKKEKARQETSFKLS